MLSLPEYLAALHRGGHRHRPITGEVRLDEQEARESTCPRCFHRGMAYIALGRSGQLGHVGVAWCPRCWIPHNV